MTHTIDSNTPVLYVTAPARALVTGDGMNEVNHVRIDAAVSSLTRLGWAVRETASVRAADHRFAGSDALRAESLMEALCAGDADLVMALRGGYGTARILPLLDWERLREENFAPLIGISDITALNLALLSQLGRASWQGPTAGWFADDVPGRDAAFLRAMREEVFGLEVPASGDAFEAEGILWGGNLSIIASLAGTPWMPKVEGGILVVEDVGEPAWRIERMLLTLIDAGILTRQKALIVADMKGADKTAGEGAGRFALADAVEWIRGRSKIPCVQGLHFGHLSDTLTIPVGAEAQVVNAGGTLSVVVPHPPVPANAPGLTRPRHALWWT